MSNLCTFDSKREGEISLYCSGTSYDKLEIHFNDEEEHTYGYYEGIVEKLGVGQYQYEHITLMARTTAAKKKITIRTKILKTANEFIDLIVPGIEYAIDSFMFLVRRCSCSTLQCVFVVGKFVRTMIK